MVFVIGLHTYADAPTSCLPALEEPCLPSRLTPLAQVVPLVKNVSHHSSFSVPSSWYNVSRWRTIIICIGPVSNGLGFLIIFGCKILTHMSKRADCFHDNGNHVVFRPMLMTPNELLEGDLYAYRSFYSIRSILKRTLKPRRDIFRVLALNFGRRLNYRYFEEGCRIWRLGIGRLQLTQYIMTFQNVMLPCTNLNSTVFWTFFCTSIPQSQF